MSTVSAASVAANPQGIEGLPAALQEALGELAGAAKGRAARAERRRRARRAERADGRGGR